MARAAKIATKSKKKTVRLSRRTNGYALMPTDTWFKAKHFVHYEIESKDWLSKIQDYIRNNFDKKTVADIFRLPEWKIGTYSHWAATAAMMEKNPEAVPNDYKTGIVKWITDLAKEGAVLAATKKAEEKAKPKNTYTPTIQERINEQVDEACEAIEEWLEGFVRDKAEFDPKGFDFTAHFSNMKVSQAHARKIAARYQRELEEAQVIVNMPTPQAIAKIKDEREKDFALQLREGYKHLTKKDAQTYLLALETLHGACMLVIDASKATRKPRVKKAPSKEKMVAKLKFKQTDEKYQLASVNPLDLIQSTEIWVFNTKTRKLGKYVAAEDCSVMTVKGNTIIGYDETKSVQKTLRKPEETLKEFKNAGKIKLRKFLDEIKTTETQLNGRFSDDIIILKAYQ
jgi:hypothetical protein